MVKLLHFSLSWQWVKSSASTYAGHCLLSIVGCISVSLLFFTNNLCIFRDLFKCSEWVFWDWLGKKKNKTAYDLFGCLFLKKTTFVRKLSIFHIHGIRCRTPVILIKMQFQYFSYLISENVTHCFSHCYWSFLLPQIDPIRKAITLI